MRMSSWMTVALLGVASCANCPCQPKENTCAADGDCKDGKVCRSNSCVDPGAACLIDDTCPADRACINGFCEVGSRQVVLDAGVDAGIECALSEVTCLSASTLRVCELGHYAQVDCTRNGLTCQDGGCRPAPCEPSTADAGTPSADGGSTGGPTRCLDLATSESCATPGLLTDCLQDQTCWAGRCAKSTGQPCNADAQCAGGYCHCKPGECPDGGLANGYCSLLGCNSDGGHPCPLTDVCMGLASAGGGRQNLCGQKAAVTCPESNTGMPPGYAGPYKRYLPIPDPTNPERYTFGDAVCFDARPGAVGASCAGPTQCMGGSSVGFLGQCDTFGGVATAGYCTHGCDQTHPCAPGAACANRTGDPAGTGVCLLKCSDQKAGLAECNRTGLACKASGMGFTILDGRTDPLGFCFH